MVSMMHCLVAAFGTTCRAGYFVVAIGELAKLAGTCTVSCRHCMVFLDWAGVCADGQSRWSGCSAPRLYGS